MELSKQSKSVESKKGAPCNHLYLNVNSNLIPIFFQLLSHGFNVNVQVGGSVKDLLCNQLGLSQDYLSKRIKTIFLNAKVVDDLDLAIVVNGSTLALSGAMPGLVGAILRSGGFFASMRSQISHKKAPSTSSKDNGFITLKLLNLVVKELGPGFLQQGIIIDGKNLQDFLYHFNSELEAGCTSGKLNATTVEIRQIVEFDWTTGPVLLQVESKRVV
jgi:hypothetical protein